MPILGRVCSRWRQEKMALQTRAPSSDLAGPPSHTLSTAHITPPQALDAPKAGSLKEAVQVRVKSRVHASSFCPLVFVFFCHRCKRRHSLKRQPPQPHPRVLPVPRWSHACKDPLSWRIQNRRRAHTRTHASLLARTHARLKACSNTHSHPYPHNLHTQSIDKKIEAGMDAVVDKKASEEWGEEGGCGGGAHRSKAAGMFRTH